MILFTATGTSLWQHLVVMFGAKAAVWAYNRFGDALMHVSRILLAILLTHYVDDYSACDPGPLATSSFDSFEILGSCLRTTFKESKKQPPSASRDTLGVLPK